MNELPNLGQTFDALTRQLESHAKTAPGIRELFAGLHQELRRIARQHRGSLLCQNTLNTTALVHEAYLKLSQASHLEVVDRAHFFALAAQSMRQIVIDRARRANTAKRGDVAVHVPMDDITLSDSDARASEQALAVHQALLQLEQHSPRLAETVTMRFFAGMTEAEIGDALDRDPATVRRDWAKARAWLFRALGDAPQDSA
ncbi:RNA polymerase subunit sigma-70 [Ahniella affigens]|uniref:RNA polymerase subunit sigma-70 n=1 Tax=Ahniella affigens TaxID=2021234 RepID=A0A2P1PNZ5_9GAMM|nr:ECF-type sigma factor [Ahniella affigens]AVP96545.1 RNA polymerase subunit sigma-70 [Ahniella affigens]